MLNVEEMWIIFFLPVVKLESERFVGLLHIHNFFLVKSLNTTSPIVFHTTIFSVFLKYHTCNQNITYLEYYFFPQNPKYNGFKNNCKIENYFNQLVRNSMAVDLI